MSKGRVLRGAPQLSEADRKLQAAIEQAGMMPPAAPPSVQVLRVENVGLDIQVDVNEHRLIVVALNGAKFANLFDVIVVPMDPSFAQRLVGQWTGKADALAEKVAALGPRLAAVAPSAEAPGPEDAAS